MPKFQITRRFVNPKVLAAAIHQMKLKAIIAGGVVLDNQIRPNVSVPALGGTPDDHALALSRLDHPYATRHGSIQINPSGGTTPGISELYVHTVTGRLLRSLKGKVKNDTPSFNIGFDLRSAPHARMVVRGTSILLPRDILWETAIQEESKKKIFKAAGTAFVSEFKRTTVPIQTVSTSGT